MTSDAQRWSIQASTWNIRWLSLSRERWRMMMMIGREHGRAVMFDVYHMLECIRKSPPAGENNRSSSLVFVCSSLFTLKNCVCVFGYSEIFGCTQISLNKFSILFHSLLHLRPLSTTNNDLSVSSRRHHCRLFLTMGGDGRRWLKFRLHWVVEFEQ